MPLIMHCDQGCKLVHQKSRCAGVKHSNGCGCVFPDCTLVCTIRFFGMQRLKLHARRKRNRKVVMRDYRLTTYMDAYKPFKFLRAVLQPLRVNTIKHGNFIFRCVNGDDVTA